jgi:hypothetical protein
LAEAFSKCLELFKNRREFYEKIDLRIAALCHNQSWYNIRTKILLLAERASNISEKMVDVENFVIVHQRLNSDEFVKLLQDINTGNSEIQGLKINFFANPIPPLNLQHHYLRDSLRTKEMWNIEWPVNWYEWEQNHPLQNELANVFEETDLRLRRFNTPYRDVEEAVIDLLNLPKYHFQENYSKDSKCSILMPNFVAIESAKLEGSKLDITARFHESMHVEDIILSVIGYGRETSRFRENLKGGRKIVASPPFVRVNKSFEIKDVADVQLYLFSNKMDKNGVLDQRLTRNLKPILNSRVASHEVFDEGSARLLEWLRGEAKRDVKHNFEYSVATLLHMCGFRTEWLDYPGMTQDAPDILAFCSEPNLLIVGECTMILPDLNKYRDLKERAEKLQNRLGINTCAVMFTGTEASYDEQGDASKYNVSFVGPKKLKELHDMATRGKTTREILYTLTGRSW